MLRLAWVLKEWRFCGVTMPDEFDMRSVGGVLYVRDGGDANNPADQHWNFGVMGQPGIEGPIIADSAPNFYDVAPNAQGRWDGKTSICCHDAARKVLGSLIPAQMQPKGTCGSRTGKQALRILQGILINAGHHAKFHNVSHAWIYGIARKEYGMLGSGDGVPDGSIPPVLAKYGALTIEEANDTNDYGPGSDDLAAKWGGRNGPPQELFKLAADNEVETTLVKARSFQELADGYAIGGVGLVSSNRGFSMTRDANGFCRAQGSWSHYMTGSGIAVIKDRGCPTIDQSWGRNTPGGPTIEDGRWPDYSFAADPDVVERDMIKDGSFHLIFGFALWDESKWTDWMA